MEFKKPIAFFLCGGGSLGAWQSGALYSLYKSKIEAEFISGFSIGAINSLFYCFDEIDKLKRIWRKIDNKKIFKFSISYHKPVRIYVEEKSNALKRFFDNIENFLSGFSIYDGDVIERILKRYLTLKLKFKENLKFFCISHCVETSAPYIVEFNSKNYDREKIIKMVRASSSIPFIFPPVLEKTNYKYIHLVDGGVIGKKNISLEFLNQAKTIFIISNTVDEDIHYKMKKNTLFEYIEKKMRRILSLHVKKIYLSSMHISTKPDVFFVSPKKQIESSILDFNPDNSKILFNMGEKEMDEFLNNLVSL